MKSLLMLVVFLPHMISADSSTDNEKYSQQLTPSQSLYCNDLNPQSHLDFNMVIDLLSTKNDSWWSQKEAPIIQAGNADLFFDTVTHV